MRFSNASFPTKKDDILVLLSRSLFHVRIERDPFAGFFDELSLSAPKPNLKSYHDTLSSYLGPVNIWPMSATRVFRVRVG